ncbi:AAA family ATPase [Saccharothrix sp.]|uniref:AAA family ATPase n=1 Tax=Saccharothrix sp. TaxID=1873460 RepID=UPI00281177C5|nr:AAA family ATPase [Saccharothrix sp.]
MLARWSGWGAAGQLFDKDQFAAQRAHLRELLTEEQYAAARRSTINAHYTDGSLVSTIWDALGRLGFDGGEVLEPGCGSGHFIGLAPDTARMTGVEREPVSATIAAALYPHATVIRGSFADVTAAEGSFDAAVGNVPFAKVKLDDPKHNPGRQHSIHNHFIIKSLRLTRPGGLVAVLTSRFTMDARNPAARREMAQLADLVGAVRLPTGAHRRAAGTDAVTDLLILRRRADGAEPLVPTDSWDLAMPVMVGDAEAMVEVNRYFLDHPEQVLGEFAVEHGMHNAETLEVKGALDRLGVDFALAVDRVVARALEQGLVMRPRVEAAPRPAATVTVVDPEAARFSGSLNALDDGTFTVRVGAIDLPYTPQKKEDVGELRALIGVRNVALALIREEQESVDDTPRMDELRAELNRVYDDYAATYGPINRFTERRQLRQVWHVFGEWCDRKGYNKLPASTDTVTAYLGELHSYGLSRTQLERHLKGLVKSHASAFDRSVKAAAVSLAKDAKSIDSQVDVKALAAKLLAETQPEKLLRRANMADLRLPADIVAAGQAIVDQGADEDLPNDVLDELNLRMTVINRPSQGGFRDDPFANVARALEKFDPVTQSARKANIFTQRVINPPRVRLGAETAEEAVAICMDTHSRIDLDEIASLMGLPDRDRAREALGTLVYDDPALIEPVWAPFYLAGNVRQKLAIARRAAEMDPRYEVNVAALEKVIPRDLGPEEIEVRLGSWIGPEYVQAFLRELLEDDNVRVEGVAGLWLVSTDKSKQSKATVLKANEIWGGGGKDAYDLTESLLFGAPIEVFKKVEAVRSDGTTFEKDVLDPEATAEAVDKASEISERFADWVWEDSERAQQVMRQYNDNFNAEIEVDYSTVELALPGLSQAYRLHDHQKIAVARIVHQGGTGLVHEVGAGKTLEMIVGVMERRRRGLANKPVIVVPNDSIAEQFEREWLQAYPAAKLLAGTTDAVSDKETEKSKGRNRRAEFVARVATGDWDAVIMTKESFQRIPLPPDIQGQFLRRELDDLLAAKTAHAESMSQSMTKRIESAMDNAEARLKSQLDAIDRDVAGMTFTEAGFDFVVVDEAQNYKNGLVISAIPDLAIEGAYRSIDLDMKLGHLQERFGTARVVLATATPWTGKFSEVYLWMRRLGHDLPRFDTWARTYVTQKNFLEMTPGGTLRPKSRTRGTINETDLWRSLRLTSDVKMKQDLNLATPELRGGRIEILEVPASVQARLFTLDAARRERELKGPPEKGKDNHLVIAHDGQLAALDLRTVGITTPEPQKVDIVAADIFAEWNAARDNVYLRDDGTEHPVRGGLILVFCDESTPTSRHWNFYTELREQLVSRGMDEKSVRFIHEASSPQRKADLLAAAREGAVSVLVGSTMKMGAGINVQDRVLGGYEITGQWRPDITAQAIGRAERQGNQNKFYFWKRVVLAPSMDAKKWEITSQKAQMFAPLYSSTPPERTREIASTEIDSLAETMVAATGDMRHKEKADLDEELGHLKRRRSKHIREQQALKLSVINNRAAIPKLERRAEQQDQVAARLVTTEGEKFSMVVGETTFSKRTEAVEALRQTLANAMATAPRSGRGTVVPIGSLGGLAIEAAVYPLNEGDQRLVLRFPEANLTASSTSVDPGDLPKGIGLITRLENKLKVIAAAGDRTREDIAETLDAIEAAEAEVGKAFPYEHLIDEYTQRRAVLVSELSEVDDLSADPDEDPNSPEAIARRERREARHRELTELASTARDLALQLGFDGAAAQSFGAWYSEITGPVLAAQRPPIEPALDVWLSIGRPDRGGRTRLAPLGARSGPTLPNLGIPDSLPTGQETAGPLLDTAAGTTPAESVEPRTAESRTSSPSAATGGGVQRDQRRDPDRHVVAPADTTRPGVPPIEQIVSEPAGLVALESLTDAADTAQQWARLEQELTTAGFEHVRRDEADLGGVDYTTGQVLTDAGWLVDEEVRVLAAHVEEVRIYRNNAVATEAVDAIMAADVAGQPALRPVRNLLRDAGLLDSLTEQAAREVQLAVALRGVARAAAGNTDAELHDPGGDRLRTDEDLNAWIGYTGSPLNVGDVQIYLSEDDDGLTAQILPNDGRSPSAWVPLRPQGEGPARLIGAITDTISRAGQIAEDVRRRVTDRLARSLNLPPVPHPLKETATDKLRDVSEALSSLPRDHELRDTGLDLLRDARAYDAMSRAVNWSYEVGMLWPGPPVARVAHGDEAAALVALGRAALSGSRNSTLLWRGVRVDLGYLGDRFHAVLSNPLSTDRPRLAAEPGHRPPADNGTHIALPLDEQWIIDGDGQRIAAKLDDAVLWAEDRAHRLLGRIRDYLADVDQHKASAESTAGAVAALAVDQRPGVPEAVPDPTAVDAQEYQRLRRVAAARRHRVRNITAELPLWEQLVDATARARVLAASTPRRELVTNADGSSRWSLNTADGITILHGRSFVHAIGNRAPRVSSAQVRELGRRLADLRDADGNPVPFAAPGYRTWSQGWRDAEGRTLAAAIDGVAATWATEQGFRYLDSREHSTPAPPGGPIDTDGFRLARPASEVAPGDVIRLDGESREVADAGRWTTQYSTKVGRRTQRVVQDVYRLTFTDGLSVNLPGPETRVDVRFAPHHHVLEAGRDPGMGRWQDTPAVLDRTSHKDQFSILDGTDAANVPARRVEPGTRLVFTPTGDPGYDGRSRVGEITGQLAYFPNLRPTSYKRVVRFADGTLDLVDINDEQRVVLDPPPEQYRQILHDWNSLPPPSPRPRELPTTVPAPQPSQRPTLRVVEPLLHEQGWARSAYRDIRESGGKPQGIPGAGLTPQEFSLLWVKAGTDTSPKAELEVHLSPAGVVTRIQRNPSLLDGTNPPVNDPTLRDVVEVAGFTASEPDTPPEQSPSAVAAVDDRADEPTASSAAAGPDGIAADTGDQVAGLQLDANQLSAANTVLDTVTGDSTQARLDKLRTEITAAGYAWSRPVGAVIGTVDHETATIVTDYSLSGEDELLVLAAHVGALRRHLNHDAARATVDNLLDGTDLSNREAEIRVADALRELGVRGPALRFVRERLADAAALRHIGAAIESTRDQPVRLLDLDSGELGGEVSGDVPWTILPTGRNQAYTERGLAWGLVRVRVLHSAADSRTLWISTSAAPDAVYRVRADRNPQLVLADTVATATEQAQRRYDSVTSEIALRMPARRPDTKPATQAGPTQAGSTQADPATVLPDLEQVLGATAEQAAWIRSRLVTLTQHPLLRNTVENTPENLEPTLRAELTRVISAPLTDLARSGARPDQVALEVATRYTTRDRRFAERLFTVAAALVPARIRRDLAASLPELVDNLANDLGLSVTDRQRRWLRSWIGAAAAHDQVRQWARVNARDQIQHVLDEHLIDAAVHAVVDDGAEIGPDVPGFVLDDPSIAQFWLNMARHAIYEEVNELHDHGLAHAEREPSPATGAAVQEQTPQASLSAQEDSPERPSGATSVLPPAAELAALYPSQQITAEQAESWQVLLGQLADQGFTIKTQAPDPRLYPDRPERAHILSLKSESQVLLIVIDQDPALAIVDLARAVVALQTGASWNLTVSEQDGRALLATLIRHSTPGQGTGEEHEISAVESSPYDVVDAGVPETAAVSDGSGEPVIAGTVGTRAAQVGHGGRLLQLVPRPMADRPVRQAPWRTRRDVAAQLLKVGVPVATVEALQKSRAVVASPSGALWAFQARLTGAPKARRGRRWFIVHVPSGAQLGAMLAHASQDRPQVLFSNTRSDAEHNREVAAFDLPDHAVPGYLHALEHLLDARGAHIDWTRPVDEVWRAGQAWRDLDPTGSLPVEGSHPRAAGLRALDTAALMHLATEEREQIPLTEAFSRALKRVSPGSWERIDGRWAEPATTALLDLEHELTNVGPRVTPYPVTPPTDEEKRNERLREQDSATLAIVRVADAMAFGGQPHEAVDLLRARAERIAPDDEFYNGGRSHLLHRAADRIAELFSPQPIEIERLARAQVGDVIAWAGAMEAGGPDVTTWEVVDAAGPERLRPGDKSTVVVTARRLGPVSEQVKLRLSTTMEPGQRSVDVLYQNRNNRDLRQVGRRYLGWSAVDEWAVLDAGTPPPTNRAELVECSRRAILAFQAQALTAAPTPVVEEPAVRRGPEDAANTAVLAAVTAGDIDPVGPPVEATPEAGEALFAVSDLDRVPLRPYDPHTQHSTTLIQYHADTDVLLDDELEQRWRVLVGQAALLGRRVVIQGDPGWEDHPEGSVIILQFGMTRRTRMEDLERALTELITGPVGDEEGELLDERMEALLADGTLPGFAEFVTDQPLTVPDGSDAERLVDWAARFNRDDRPHTIATRNPWELKTPLTLQILAAGFTLVESTTGSAEVDHRRGLISLPQAAAKWYDNDALVPRTIATALARAVQDRRAALQSGAREDSPERWSRRWDTLLQQARLKGLVTEVSADGSVVFADSDEHGALAAGSRHTLDPEVPTQLRVRWLSRRLAAAPTVPLIDDPSRIGPHSQPADVRLPFFERLPVGWPGFLDERPRAQEPAPAEPVVHQHAESSVVATPGTPIVDGSTPKVPGASPESVPLAAADQGQDQSGGAVGPVTQEDLGSPASGGGRPATQQEEDQTTNPQFGLFDVQLPPVDQFEQALASRFPERSKPDAEADRLLAEAVAYTSVTQAQIQQVMDLRTRISQGDKEAVLAQSELLRSDPDDPTKVYGANDPEFRSTTMQWVGALVRELADHGWTVRHFYPSNRARADHYRQVDDLRALLLNSRLPPFTTASELADIVHSVRPTPQPELSATEGSPPTVEQMSAEPHDSSHRDRLFELKEAGGGSPEDALENRLPERTKLDPAADAALADAVAATGVTEQRLEQLLKLGADHVPGNATTWRRISKLVSTDLNNPQQRHIAGTPGYTAAVTEWLAALARELIDRGWAIRHFYPSNTSNPVQIRVLQDLGIVLLNSRTAVKRGVENLLSLVIKLREGDAQQSDAVDAEAAQPESAPYATSEVGAAITAGSEPDTSEPNGSGEAQPDGQVEQPRSDQDGDEYTASERPTLSQWRDLAANHRLEVRVTRVADQAWIVVHERTPGAPVGQPDQPAMPAVLAIPVEADYAVNGAGRSLPLTEVAEYLAAYRERLSSQLFTVSTGLRDWPRRLAQLAPYMVDGPDARQAVADEVADTLRHASERRPRDAEDALRRAENAAGPLRPTPEREAQIVRAVHDYAAAYDIGGDVGRTLTESKNHLDGSWQEWSWINAYLGQHPELKKTQPEHAAITARDRAELAEQERRGAEFNSLAAQAFKEGDYAETLRLLDQAEIEHPSNRLRWDDLRERVRTRAAETPGTSQPAAPTDESPAVPEPVEDAVAGQGRPTVVQAAGEPVLFTPERRLDVLVRVNEAAAAWFEAQFERSSTARDYLIRRLGGQDKLDAARRPLSEGTPGLMVGYAPPGWTGLVDHLSSRGFRDDELVEAGVARVSSAGNLIDVFRDRIVFGLRTLDGRMAGFTGRPPRDDFAKETPKYLNTATTPLFNKGEILFGLHEQRDRVPHAKPVMIEGPTDVLAHAAARDPEQRLLVVAACGTAVTREHLRLLDQVVPPERGRVLALDGDGPGAKAGLRLAQEELPRYRQALEVTMLPDGMDPAEWALNRPLEQMIRAYLAPPYTKPAVDVLVEATLERFADKLDFVDGRVDAARAVAKLLAIAGPSQVVSQVTALEARLQLRPGDMVEFVTRAWLDTVDFTGDNTEHVEEIAALLASVDPRLLSRETDSPAVLDAMINAEHALRLPLGDLARLVAQRRQAASAPAVAASSQAGGDPLTGDPMVDLARSLGLVVRLDTVGERQWITVSEQTPSPSAVASWPVAARQFIAGTGSAHDVPVLESYLRSYRGEFGIATLALATEVPDWASRVARLAPFAVTGPTYRRDVVDNLNRAIRMVRDGGRDAEAAYWLVRAESAAPLLPLPSVTSADVPAGTTSDAPPDREHQAAATNDTVPAPAPVDVDRKAWSRRIAIRVTGTTAFVTGTDATDPAPLRSALKDNGFWWRKNDQHWEWVRSRKQPSRDDAVQALRDALDVLDAQAATEAETKAAAKAAAAKGPTFPPTPQQQAIQDAFAQGLNIAVRALAGTGKTTTLRLLAAWLAANSPDKKIVYIAFNRSIANEAQEAFGPNVEADTMHAIARHALNNHPRLGMKVGGNIAKNDGFGKDIASALGLNPDGRVRYGTHGQHEVTANRLMSMAIAVVKKYRESADREIGAAHLHPDIAADPSGLGLAVLDWARRIWQDKSSPEGTLPFTHDDYLKIWALGNPVFPGDVIFFDEVQDVNPLQAALVQAQSAQTVVVGDTYQSIYGFRGAQDFLTGWPADETLDLTKSWRFGVAVQDVGNLFLELLESDLRLEGNPALDTRLDVVDEPDAVIARTNAGAVAAVVEGIEAGERVALVGGGKDLVDIALAAQELQRGRETKHPELKSFSHWDDVRDYVEEHEEAKSLRAFVRLVDKYTPEGLIRLARQLVDENAIAEDLKPQLVVSTAHKAKGREWDKVKVADDFRGPTTDDDGNIVLPDPETLRLSYVTVTRAKRVLELGSLGWILDFASKTVQTPAEAPEQATAVSRTEQEVAGTENDAVAAPEAAPSPEKPTEVAPAEPRETAVATDGLISELRNVPGRPLDAFGHTMAAEPPAELLNSRFPVLPQAVNLVNGEALRQWLELRVADLPRQVGGLPAGPARLALATAASVLVLGEDASVADVAWRVAGSDPLPLHTAVRVRQFADGLSGLVAHDLSARAALGRYHSGRDLPGFLVAVGDRIERIARDPMALARARARLIFARIDPQVIENADVEVRQAEEGADPVRDLLGHVLPPELRGQVDPAALKIVNDSFVALALKVPFDPAQRAAQEIADGRGFATAVTLRALAVEGRARVRDGGRAGRMLRRVGWPVIAQRLDEVAGRMEILGRLDLPDEDAPTPLLTRDDPREDTPDPASIAESAPPTVADISTAMTALPTKYFAQLVRDLDRGTVASPLDGAEPVDQLDGAAHNPTFRHIEFRTRGLTVEVRDEAGHRTGRLTWKQVQDWVSAGVTPATRRVLLEAESTLRRFEADQIGFDLNGEAELAATVTQGELAGYSEQARRAVIERAAQAHRDGTAVKPRRRRRAGASDSAALPLTDGLEDLPESITAALDRVAVLGTVLTEEADRVRTASRLKAGDVVVRDDPSGLWRLTRPPRRAEDHVALVGEWIDRFGTALDAASGWQLPAESGTDPEVRVVARPGSLARLVSAPRPGALHFAGTRPDGPSAQTPITVPGEFGLAELGWRRISLEWDQETRTSVEQLRRGDADLLLRWAPTDDGLALLSPVELNGVARTVTSLGQVEDLLRPVEPARTELAPTQPQRPGRQPAQRQTTAQDTQLDLWAAQNAEDAPRLAPEQAVLAEVVPAAAREDRPIDGQSTLPAAPDAVVVALPAESNTSTTGVEPRPEATATTGYDADAEQDAAWEEGDAHVDAVEYDFVAAETDEDEEHPFADLADRETALVDGPDGPTADAGVVRPVIAAADPVPLSDAEPEAATSADGVADSATESADREGDYTSDAEIPVLAEATDQLAAPDTTEAEPRAAVASVPVDSDPHADTAEPEQATSEQVHHQDDEHPFADLADCETALVEDPPAGAAVPEGPVSTAGPSAEAVVAEAGDILERALGQRWSDLVAQADLLGFGVRTGYERDSGVTEDPKTIVISFDKPALDRLLDLATLVARVAVEQAGVNTVAADQVLRERAAYTAYEFPTFAGVLDVEDVLVGTASTNRGAESRWRLTGRLDDVPVTHAAAYAAGRSQGWGPVSDTPLYDELRRELGLPEPVSTAPLVAEPASHQTRAGWQAGWSVGRPPRATGAHGGTGRAGHR